MKLYEAIYGRQSIRNYEMKPLEEKTLQSIQNYMTNLNSYKEDIAYEFLLVENLQEESGLSGLFHVKAPYYLILSAEKKTDSQIQCGYVMQQMVLYLTAMNLGTCYQGGVTPNAKLKDKLNYDYVIAIAFGCSKKELYRKPVKAKRLAESQLVLYKEEVDDLVKTVLSAAIISPSAFNRQPWRFVVYKNRIHVFCKKSSFLETRLGEMKQLDIGIMLANMSQAADELWLTECYLKVDSIKEKSFKNNEYITTVLLKERVF